MKNTENLTISEQDLELIVQSKKSFRAILESLQDKYRLFVCFDEQFKVFDRVIEIKLLTHQDILYLFDVIKKENDFLTLKKFSKNSSLFKYVIENMEEADFKSFIDLFLLYDRDAKSSTIFGSGFELFLPVFESEDCLNSFLSSKACTAENVQHIVQNIITYNELWKFDDSSYFLKKIVEYGYISFKELTDKYCSVAERKDADPEEDHLLLWLLHKTQLWRDLLKDDNKLVTFDDLKYFLSKIDNEKLLNKLCDDNNLFLAKYCFDNFLFDESTLQKYTKILRKNGVDQNLFFSYVQRNFSSASWSDPTENYRKIYELLKRPTQRQKIYSIVQNSEKAKNTLLQILNNNLLDQYGFEQLKSLLTRDEEKKKTKLNF